MYETDEDLARLQQPLDESYARAGEHLRGIWTPPTRLSASALCEECKGVQVMDLATVNARGEPRVSPVDGLLYRGRFWFGTAPNSWRMRNIRRNPAVSGSITRGLETFLVVVHGRAEELDPRSPEAEGFARYPRELYDFDWDSFHSESPYARIEVHTLLAFKRPS